MLREIQQRDGTDFDLDLALEIAKTASVMAEQFLGACPACDRASVEFAAVVGAELESRLLTPSDADV